MKKNNMLLRFHSKEKAEQLANMGFAYMIDNSGEEPEYVFSLNDDIAKKLVMIFNDNDYYFTNRLCFCIDNNNEYNKKSKLSVININGKGGDADDE